MSSDASAEATTLGAGEGAEGSWIRPGFTPGETVGRYAVLDRIGAGGMGVVYAAYDPKLDRKVAIKILHGSAPTRDGARGQQRLIREAQALARLNHPNVVTVNDVGVHEGRVFVAMDFIEGRTLRAWLDARPPWREVVRVMIEAGRGLAAAHDRGLVHRDFKPDNVMIGADGRVVVMDFGLAHPIASPDSEASSLPSEPVRALNEATAHGRLVGTPLYMAPEQFSGDEVGPATDVFAFCVVLWEALHGERPFSGKNPAELARQVGEGVVRIPSSGPRVPAALRRVAMRGLAVSPADRWPSMHDLLRALARDPIARRRRVAWAIAIAAAAVVVPGARSLARSRAFAACLDEIGSTEGVWNPDVATSIEHAMLATGVTYAGDAWSRARVGLDGASAAWLEERDRLCAHAPELEGPRAEATRACLEHARASLAVIAELLADADAGAVPHVTRMVASLPDARRCDTARAVAPKVDGGAQPPLASIRAAGERLSRLRARSAVGRYEDVLALGERLREEAVASQDRWLEAETVYEIARALDQLGRYDDAHARYEEAYYLASALESPLVVRSAAGLVWVAGLRLDRHDDALRWYRTALSLAERLRIGDEPEMAELLNAVGSVYEAKGDYEEALAIHERALAIRLALYGPERAVVALSLNNIAMARQNLGDRDTAVRLMRRAIEITERADGPMHPDVAMMLGNLGNLRWAQGDFDEALALQRRALEIEEVVFGLEHPRVARTILNLGVLRLGRQEYEPALESFRRALAIQERTLGPDHLDVAATLNNIANVHFHRERYDEALAAYERALAIRRDVLGPRHQRVGTLHDNIGRVLEARGELDAAIVAYETAADTLEHALGVQHPLLGMALHDLGNALLEQGDTARAVATLERAVVVLQPGTGDPDLLAAARFALGRAISSTGGDLARARSLAELALRHYDDGSHETSARAVRSWLAKTPGP